MLKPRVYKSASEFAAIGVPHDIFVDRRPRPVGEPKTTANVSNEPLIAPLAGRQAVGELTVTDASGDGRRARAAGAAHGRARRRAVDAHDRQHPALVPLVALHWRARMAEPLPLCYLNGEYLPLDEARISPLDRGFLYGDGVYEVMPVYGGRPFRFDAHLRAADAQPRRDPHGGSAHRARSGARSSATLIERNGGGDQYVYWQVTRGAELGRNHAPLPEIPRTVFAFCAPLPASQRGTLENGVACVTAQDTRWARCDIKSVSLLANVLLRQLAVDAGAAETILLRDGELTGGSASAVHVVIDGEIRTPPQLAPDSAGHDARRGRGDGRRARHLAAARRDERSRSCARADEIWISRGHARNAAGDHPRRPPGRRRAPGPALAARVRGAAALQAGACRHAVVN